MYISASLEASGQWETLLTGLVQRALNRYPNSLFLNLGANIGYYSLLAARMNHQVIAGKFSIHGTHGSLHTMIFREGGLGTD